MRHPNWATLVPDETQPWQTLQSREAVPPPRSVLIDRVRTHQGAELDYTYRPRGPRAVFVLPVTGDGRVAFIHQYRYPLRATILEVVAGGVERGEEPIEAAQRELAEEVGGVASEWVTLPGFYPQPSISGVVFYPLLALGVQLGEAHLEASELIERELVPLSEAYRRLMAGEIQDASSSLTLFHARPELERRGLM